MQGQKPATAKEQRRLDRIAGLWCLPSAMNFFDGVPATVQHVVEGRVRLGHEWTYPASSWHHLGLVQAPYQIDEMTARFGPSLQHDLRLYEEVFAPERDLVAITDAVLELQAELENAGDYLTAEAYGMFVRQEAYNRFGRRVMISR